MSLAIRLIEQYLSEGATDFYCDSTGSSAKDAFQKAQEQARHMYGHEGYTGSIAEKDSFIMLTPDVDINDKKAMNAWVDKTIDSHPKISDKWGPAGCVALGSGKYFFFGLASS
jgi:hypothetical protein